MFVEALQRHLLVCAQKELPGILARDRAFWHVVSIREPYRPQPDFQLAKRTCEVLFLDQESTDDSALGTPPRQAHLEKVFKFADTLPDAPLLIHCWAGRSRSTAAALALIVRGLWKNDVHGPALITQAADALLAVRPVARPNVLVLRLGLELFLPAQLASTLAKALVNEPRLLHNRFVLPNQ